MENIKEEIYIEADSWKWGIKVLGLEEVGIWVWSTICSII
jgi:hypothetical protein